MTARAIRLLLVMHGRAAPETSMPSEHVDVLIVGAGLSGIGAGYHLQRNCPGKSYAILEGRDCIGGTRDLFRYPGVRPPRGPGLYRRHLGSFPLSRLPLRQRHVHTGLFVQAMDRAEGDRRRTADP